MKKIFKYDFFNKKTNFCFLYFCLGIIVTIYLIIAELYKGLLLILLFDLMFAFATIYYSKKGIEVDYSKKNIIIRDKKGKQTFSFNKIRNISVKEIKKTNKGLKNSLFLFLLGVKEEVETWNYVYNHGKVYSVIFEIDNDSGGYFINKSYFGWMYKEKNKEIVESVEKQLYEFIDNINLQIKNK